MASFLETKHADVSDKHSCTVRLKISKIRVPDVPSMGTRPRVPRTAKLHKILSNQQGTSPIRSSPRRTAAIRV